MKARFGVVIQIKTLTHMKKYAWMAAFVVAVACTESDPEIATQGTIDTFAGSSFGYEGDGGPALDAKFGYVTSVSIDANGNVYVADAAANTIRKIDSTKVVNLVAGKFLGFNVVNMTPYTGDGGPATNANLNVPQAITVSPNGDLYISDAGNNVVRKVDAKTGKIATIAGKVLQGSSGDNGPAVNALIYNPNGLATDVQGNVYIVDSQNHTIRKISITGTITTIAGIPGEAGYSGDGGPATAAKLSFPAGIAIDNSGNIYVSDNSSVIRRIGMDGHISTIAGNGKEGFGGDGGKATEAQLLAPKGIAIAIDGSILVADAGNNRIRRITQETGIIQTIAGTGEAGYAGDGGPAVNAKMSNPQGIAVDKKGNIYVAESGSSVIRIIRWIQ